MDHDALDAAPSVPAVFCQTALLTEGWRQNVRLRVADGRLIGIDPDAAPQPGDEVVAIALPGLPNLHSHAFQRGMAGLAEQRGPAGDSFWTWREVMYRFVGNLRPEDLQAIAAQAYVEMLECGFTRVAEFHYLHHDLAGRPFSDPAEMGARIAAAAAQSGIGLTLLPVFYAHGGFGGAAIGAAQARFVHDCDGYAKLIDASRAAVAFLPDAVVGIAPHSLRAVTPEQLQAILPLAQGGPIHIHIAEQQREVDDCLAWSGARPVQWLLRTLPVGPAWCLVHATHITDAERDAIARCGAVAGLCPITEANLGDGLFPLQSFLAAGGLIGVGSDSNVLISANEELRLLEYGQRLQHRGRNLAAAQTGQSTGRSLFDAARDGGARAVGTGAGLAAGAPADIIALDPRHPALAERAGDALLDSFIFAAGSGAVESVWRGGRKLVAGGRHHRRKPILREFRAALKRLIG